MKAVSAYRPFPATNVTHQRLGPFDWRAALQMLRVSVRESCGCETFNLTDVDTTLPGPTYAYQTTERRLMLWLLEIARCYLQSDDFDQDTIWLSPDTLVLANLRPYFKADLGVMVRPQAKYRARPLLNSVQFWRHAAKDRLITFYRMACAIAPTLPEASLVWGADTEPLVQLLEPIADGPMPRAGLLAWGFDTALAFRGMTASDIAGLQRGQFPKNPSPIVDFKYLRKRHMAAYFTATFGARVPA